MREEYTISQLARAADVPTSTVRYYERIGLLTPEDRSSGNYRLYGNESLRRLNFIRAAQATGFTLDDVKELLGKPNDRQPPCNEVQALIEERLVDIKKRLEDLRHVQQVLEASLKQCQQTESTGCCHVIQSLDNATKD